MKEESLKGKLPDLKRNDSGGFSVEKCTQKCCETFAVCKFRQKKSIELLCKFQRYSNLGA